jgi:hypothetical protein
MPFIGMGKFASTSDLLREFFFLIVDGVCQMLFLYLDYHVIFLFKSMNVKNYTDWCWKVKSFLE